jgi:hypothetical protein
MKNYSKTNIELNPWHRCHDCGSTKLDHHTPTCELAPEDAIRDLPEQFGTQWWTETSLAQHYAAGADCLFDPILGVLVNSKTGKPGAGAYRGPKIQ